VLIPAFSVERTQELLFELDKLLEAKKIPPVPVYLDSPLAIRATELYRHFKHFLQFDERFNPDQDFFSFKGLHETMQKEASMTINEDHRPKIIIAGNGMMTGGRILHHLRRYLEDERSGLLVIGFQAPGTLGRKILDRVPTVKIYRDELKVRLEVEQIGAFSAHGDRRKLAKWLHPTEGTLQKVFLVHGEDGSKTSFKEYAAKAGVTGEIFIPRLHQTFEW
jgi:metallo-beta-lactamase family protein